jgi:hypothetical protein
MASACASRYRESLVCRFNCTVACTAPTRSRVANDNHVRLRDDLQARRKVRRLANNGSLLRVPRADELTDDHKAGRNSDTGLQGSGRLDRGNRYDQLEPGPHSPLRVIFMGPRIAKMHQDAVPHVSRHESVVPLHGLGHAFLIGGDVTSDHSGAQCDANPAFVGQRLRARQRL